MYLLEKVMNRALRIRYRIWPDSGYDSYVSAVKQAETSGKIVTSVTKQYFGFFTKVTAYASN
jgi:hypothetical protein